MPCDKMYKDLWMTAAFAHINFNISSRSEVSIDIMSLYKQMLCRARTIYIL